MHIAGQTNKNHATFSDKSERRSLAKRVVGEHRRHSSNQIDAVVGEGLQMKGSRWSDRQQGMHASKRHDDV